MKRKICLSFLISLIIGVSLFSLTGCDTKKLSSDKNINNQEDTEKKEEIQNTNTQVGDLKYYVPAEYQIHNELRGFLYTDNTRKVYAKGNVNDNNDAIYIDTYIVDTKLDLVSYIENANKSLNEKDVKITFFKDIILSKGTASVFAREGYILRKNGVETLNYAYFTYNNGKLYTVNIHGPNAKSDEIKILSKEVVDSLKF